MNIKRNKQLQYLSIFRIVKSVLKSLATQKSPPLARKAGEYGSLDTISLRTTIPGTLVMARSHHQR